MEGHPPGQCSGLGVAACVSLLQALSRLFPEQIQLMDPLRGHPSFYYTQWHSYLPACNMKQVFQHKRMYRAEKYHIMGNVKTSPSTVRLVPIKCFSWINTSLPRGMKKVGGT